MTVKEKKDGDFFFFFGSIKRITRINKENALLSKGILFQATEGNK